MTQAVTLVSIETLSSGSRFFWGGRWYEWRPVTVGDARHLAYFLRPNEPAGTVGHTGHTMEPGTEVEVLWQKPTTVESDPDKYFSDFGTELDNNPVGIGLARSTGSL